MQHRQEIKYIAPHEVSFNPYLPVSVKMNIIFLSSIFKQHLLPLNGSPHSKLMMEKMSRKKNVQVVIEGKALTNTMSEDMSLFQLI